MEGSLTSDPIQSYRVLGVRVDGVQISDTIRVMESWIEAPRRCRYVAVTGMHGINEAQADPAFKDVLNIADLVVPDGMPLVWLGRRRGIPLGRRVYGPELMSTFCAQTSDRFAHFLYGGAPGVADALRRVLEEKFQVRVVGTYCPPFRPLTEEEQDSVAETINESGADVVWVGLSTPKQERWMHDNRHRLKVPVLVGVGAAFDFLTGRKPTAPRWMQEGGLEWLYRLLWEPRRLWRRYLIGGSRFALAVWREERQLKTSGR